MPKFENLPNEIIIRILSHLKKIELGQCAQVSKRFHEISRSESLWQQMNLCDQIITTRFLEYSLTNGCKHLSLQGASLEGHLNLKTSKLKYLNLSYCKAEEEVFEDLVNSSNSIEKLSMQDFTLNSRFIQGIIQNGQNLRILDLS